MIKNLYESSQFNSTLVKKIHAIITKDMKGDVPRGFCWITLIPGQYNIIDQGENLKSPTFSQLKEVGLLMEI